MDIRYSYRGTEEHVYQYAKYIYEKGADARVLVPTYTNRAFVERQDYDSVRSIFEKVPQKTIKGRILHLPFNYKLYVYGGLPNDSIIYFAYSVYDHIFNIMTKPKGQKYVIAAHGMHLKNGHIIKNHKVIEGIFNYFIRFVLSRRDIAENVYHHVITNEEAMYLAALGVRKDRIMHVPIFVDTSAFVLGTNHAERLKVIHIGGSDKGVKVVVSIIKKLREMRTEDYFEFYFIGADQPEELLELAKHDDRLHCIGAVSDSRKSEILSAMDVMVMPATEIFPRSMLEGLSCGLYIITSGLNQAAEEVKELGAYVRVVESENAEGYVESLERVLKLKSDMVKFNDGKQNNRRVVAENFDKNIVLKRMYQMFETVDNASTDHID